MRISTFLIPLLLLVLFLPLQAPQGEGAESSEIPSRGCRVDADGSRNNGAVIRRYLSHFSYSATPPALGPDRGHFYSYSLKRSFYALNSTGRLLWSIPVPSGVYTTPAVDLMDGTVYIHMKSGSIMA